MVRTTRRVVGVGLFCLCVVPLASAEPIVVTGGFLTAPLIPPGAVSIAGTRGFSLVGEVATHEGNFQSLECSPCAPGDPLSVAGIVGGAVFSGIATLDGQTFAYTGSLDSPVNLFFEMFGGTVAPPGGSSPTTVRTPFTALGSFSAPFPGQSARFRAGGFATVFLTPVPLFPGEAPRWSMTSVRYDFVDPAAVPEPATLALVSGGLLAIAARRRRSKADRAAAAPTSPS
jgi:hypothetical protein